MSVALDYSRVKIQLLMTSVGSESPFNSNFQILNLEVRSQEIYFG